MAPDGSNVVQLTKNSASDANPAVSRDGSRIAFVSDREGQSDIYGMNVDGSGQVNLTKSAGSIELRPVWSPDGSQIALHEQSIGARSALHHAGERIQSGSFCGTGN